MVHWLQLVNAHASLNPCEVTYDEEILDVAVTNVVEEAMDYVYVMEEMHHDVLLVMNDVVVERQRDVSNHHQVVNDDEILLLLLVTMYAGLMTLS